MKKNIFEKFKDGSETKRLFAIYALLVLFIIALAVLFMATAGYK